MLACIPTEGNTGLDDSIHDHFGSAPYFTLYDSETSELTVVDNRNAHHDHGTCHPMNQLTKFKIDCVICSGMGRRAIEALSTEGIKVYQCKSCTVCEAVDRIKDGDVEEIDPRTACRGHGQRQGVGQSHCNRPQSGLGAGGRGRGFGGNRGR